MDNFKLLVIGWILFFVQEVYLSDKPGYIGCYEDSLGQTIVDVNDYKTFRDHPTVLKCIKYCKDSLKRYAGLKYHTAHMNCYCGNVTKAERSREEANCDSLCPDTGKHECAGANEITLYDIYYACLFNSCPDSETCEEVDGENCNCPEKCTEDETEKKTSSATVPIVVTLFIVLMVIVIIIISTKWRRQIQGKKQHLEIKPTQVTANRDCSIPQTLYNIGSSNYSTIHDPYNYVDIDNEGYLDNSRTCDNYSKVKSNGQYDGTNIKTPQRAFSNSNYNHIGDADFGPSLENCYSCTEKSYGRANILTRIRNDDTYNKLKADVHITTVSESLDDPEYHHTRSNQFCTKQNLFGSKEYSHLAMVDDKEHI